MSEYVVFDVETTQKAKDLPFAATPHHPDNEGVLWGTRRGGFGEISPTHCPPLSFFKNKMIVGLNLKFDLTYHAKALGYTPREYFSQLENAVLWDIGTAAYLLSAQHKVSPSLDELSQERGLEVKDSFITSMFEEGKGADEIMRDGHTAKLAEYLAQDLVNTEEIFRQQIKEIAAAGLMRLMQSQMTALKAYIEMEYNGLQVNREALVDVQTRAQSERELALFWLRTNVDKHFNFYEVVGEEFDPNKNKHLELMLFGGVYKVSERVPTGEFFKNGKAKYKTVENSRIFSAFDIVPARYTEKAPAGKQWVLDEGVFNKIEADHTGSLLGNFCKTILLYKKANKILTTYCENIWKNLYPDSKVHHSLNQNITRTGRLSCSNPNLQNQDDAVKSAFVSRYGEDGFIVEVDWAQLEIIGLAVRTQDKQLLKDLDEGVDIHTALYNDMYGRLPSKEERKAFKPLTFGLVYGAGIYTLAANSGMDTDTVKKFRLAFYTRYPQVREWHEYMLTTAAKRRVPSSAKTKLGFPAGVFEYSCPLSGRLYRFVETDGFQPGEVSFSPPDLKNHTIQGLATGDWHQHHTGTVALELWKNEHLRNLALLVNTVHDSLMFDVHMSVLPEFLSTLDKIYKEAYYFWKNHFGSIWNMPPLWEVKIGKNWKDMNVVTFNKETEKWVLA